MLKSICKLWINDSSCVFARWRHSAMNFLNKMLMTVFMQHIILQKFTNFHAIRSWNFRIFAMRWWPRSYCAILYVLCPSPCLPSSWSAATDASPYNVFLQTAMLPRNMSIYWFSVSLRIYGFTKQCCEEQAENYFGLYAHALVTFCGRLSKSQFANEVKNLSNKFIGARRQFGEGNAPCPFLAIRAWYRCIYCAVSVGVYQDTLSSPVELSTVIPEETSAR